jgi:hypothetical protein
MKFVLVDRGDNIVDSIDLGSGVGESGARTYFIGRKQIESEKFDQIWRVMSETEYRRFKAHKETIREYEEFGSWLDVEKS